MNSNYLVAVVFLAIVILAYVIVRVLIKKGIITTAQEENFVEEMEKFTGWGAIILPHILKSEASIKLADTILMYLNDAITLVKNDVNRVDSVENVYGEFITLLKQNNITVLSDSELLAIKAIIGTALARIPVIGQPEVKEKENIPVVNPAPAETPVAPATTPVTNEVGSGAPVVDNVTPVQLVATQDNVNNVNNTTTPQ